MNQYELIFKILINIFCSKVSCLLSQENTNIDLFFQLQVDLALIWWNIFRIYQNPFRFILFEKKNTINPFAPSAFKKNFAKIKTIENCTLQLFHIL